MFMSTSCPACVILVEDDPRLREALAAFLEARGYPTACAEDVEEALLLLETVDRPCLVFVDPLTIQLDWAKLFGALAESDRVATLPMVLVSVAAPGLLSRPAVLKKPVDFEILFRIAQEHCCGIDREPNKTSGDGQSAVGSAR
jgi:CheY-like chemotaxis protein